jgi:HEPN domain-containing protein
MKVQNNNYIPVRQIPNRPFNHEEREIAKELISKQEELIELTKGLIKEQEEAQEIRRAVISFKPIIEAGLAWETAKKTGTPEEIAAKEAEVQVAFKQREIKYGKLTRPINNHAKATGVKNNDFAKNVRELGGTLYKTPIKWNSNTTPYVEEFKNDYNILMKDRGVHNNKMQSAEQSLLSKKSLLESYNKPITHSSLGSREEENEIDKIINDIFKLEEEILACRKKSNSETQAYMDKINNHNLPSKTKTANEAYSTANKLSTALKQIDNNSVLSAKPINQKAILVQADFTLNLGNYRGALKDYNMVLSNRENKPLQSDYRPSEEKLRQAAQLYNSFQSIIDKLDIDSPVKKNLYCSGIAAHTQGAFSLSKAEVLHMINNQFFYPS